MVHFLSASFSSCSLRNGCLEEIAPLAITASFVYLFILSRFIFYILCLFVVFNIVIIFILFLYMNIILYICILYIIYWTIDTDMKFLCIFQ